jgi:hypothetical protein
MRPHGNCWSGSAAIWCKVYFVSRPLAAVKLERWLDEPAVSKAATHERCLNADTVQLSGAASELNGLVLFASGLPGLALFGGRAVALQRRKYAA